MRKEIKDVVDSFRTLDEIFIEIEKGNLNVLSREFGTNNYPQIRWLISYFLEIEDYHKIVFLQKLKLPEVNKERINLEKKYIKKGFYKGFRDDFEKDLKSLNKNLNYKTNKLQLQG